MLNNSACIGQWLTDRIRREVVVWTRVAAIRSGSFAAVVVAVQLSTAQRSSHRNRRDQLLFLWLAGQRDLISVVSVKCGLSNMLTCPTSLDGRVALETGSSSSSSLLRDMHI